MTVPHTPPEPRTVSADRLVVRFGGLCDLFDFAPRTARHLVARGMPHYRIGDRLYFRTDEVLLYLENFRAPSPVNVAAIVDDVTSRRERKPRKGAATA